MADVAVIVKSHTIGELKNEIKNIPDDAYIESFDSRHTWKGNHKEDITILLRFVVPDSDAFPEA